MSAEKKTCLSFTVFFIFFFTFMCQAAPKIWNQRLGPNQDGISDESGWLAKWPAPGPKVAWKVTLGEGFSSFSISGDHVYTMGNADGKDTVFCLNTNTGSVVWKYSYECKKGHHPGPRATPTIDRTLLYTISREGDVFCFDSLRGTIIWKKNLRDLGLKAPGWGFAGSPLIVGKLVIFNVGEWGAAFDKLSGRLIWKSPSNKSGFSTPLPFKWKGSICIAVFAAKALDIVEALTGKVLWSKKWVTKYDVNAATPILIDKNKIFISSNYNRGCALLELGKGIIWENKNMRNHFNKCVLWKGYLYGFDVATLKCLDVKTGKEMWSKSLGRRKSGSLMLADGKLIVLSDSGELFIAPAASSGFNPTAQAKVLDGLCWTMPVLFEGKIYCRNREGSMKCLDVSGK